MTPDQALRYADALSLRRSSLSAEERERELESLTDLRDEIAAAARRAADDLAADRYELFVEPTV